MKKHNSDQYESIEVWLDEHRHPIAFRTKVEELMESGLSEKEAINFVRRTPIELEIYYAKNLGLFGVEAEAVECTPIYNPYTAEEMDEADESEK